MATDPNDFSEARDATSVITDTRRTRPMFFDGKFLTASDLTLEQSYVLTRQADVAKTLGLGVIDGLQVAQASVSAAGLPNPAASITIKMGHGQTSSGDIVFLPADQTVDLGDVPRMMNLNASFGLSQAPQQPFYNLSGLFVVGLRAVEYTSNPTPVYPPSVDGNSQMRDGEIIEATAITLVPYDSDASQLDPAHARTRAAREIFLDQKAPALPAGILPLAMVYLRVGFLQWVDMWLVRREAGDDDRFGFGFAPRALSEAHFFHYSALVPELPSTGGAGTLSAKSILEILPPGGPLPPAVINTDDFTQAYFPPEAKVQLALVPEDELPSLMDDSLDLPPIDLSLQPQDDDALAILILAPIPRNNYADTWATLQQVRPLASALPPVLGQQKPLTALLRLNTVLQARLRMAAGDPTPATPVDPSGGFADAKWTEVLSQAPQLWYMRCRNLPDLSALAGTPVNVTPVDPAPPPEPINIVRASHPASETTPTPPATDEQKVVSTLSENALWGRYAFLRSISDAAAHARLATLMAAPVVQKNPVLQHGIISSLEHAANVKGTPIESFSEAQKDPAKHTLTADQVAKVAQEFARSDVMRGLEETFKSHPQILQNPRAIAALGHSQQIPTLAKLGLKATNHPELPKLAERVEKYAATGKDAGVRDTINRSLKKIPL